MDSVKVLKIEPGKHPVTVQLETSIKAFNRAVSIGADETGKVCSKKIDGDIYVIYNSDGYTNDLIANRKVGKEIICGVFYVVGVDTDYQPRSLTKHEMEKYRSRFWEPEVFSYTEIIENNFDVLFDFLEELENA